MVANFFDHHVTICESCGFGWSFFDRGEIRVRDMQNDGLDTRIDDGVLLTASEESVP
jgi:hypothetical protein